MTVHEAAVRAVAGVVPRVRYVADASDPYYSYRLDTAAAKAVLAALTTNADVRAGLESKVRVALANGPEWGRLGPEDAVSLCVDAVRAALGGGS